MNEEHANLKLPLPKWCFVVLAVPTFYMPLTYMTMAVCVIGQLLLGLPGQSFPEWVAYVVGAALYVTFAMWPIYIIWVAWSKRLTLREKGQWLLVVVVLNMIGMPIFYVFMIRRYLGIEGRTGPWGEAALNSFLKKCDVEKDRLSAEQLKVLRPYCFNHRLVRWCVLPLVVVGVLLAYIGFVQFPQVNIAFHFNGLFNDLSDSDALDVFRVMMTMAVMSGALGAGGIVFAGAALSQLSDGWHRKTLIDFVKSTAYDKKVVTDTPNNGVVDG